MTVARLELTDLLQSAGFGDDFSPTSRTQMDSWASPELCTLQQLSRERAPAEQSAHSWPLSHKQAISLLPLYPCKLS